MAEDLVKAIRIKDFRCLKEVAIDFTESPIICLQAGNDSGKSSIVKAIETVMFNDNQRESKNFIRTGTQGFTIEIEMASGTKVIRQRSLAGGNIYKMIDPNGTLVGDYTKLDYGQVPVEIEQLFNVFTDKETGELLNIRTCESLLLFALTKPSENYKIMHSGLKVDQVSKAILLGKNRINQLKTAIDISSSTVQGYNEQIRKLVVPDLTPLEALKQRVDDTADKVSGLNDLRVAISNLASMKQSLSVQSQGLDKVSEIDVNDMLTLNDLLYVKNTVVNVKAIRSEIEKYGSLSCVESIDIDKVNTLNELQSVCNAISELNDIKAQAGGIDLEALSSLETIDGEIVLGLSMIIESKKAISELQKQVDSELEIIEKIQSELNTALAENIKDKRVRYDADDGTLVVVCDKCGDENKVSFAELEAAFKNI